MGVMIALGFGVVEVLKRLLWIKEVRIVVNEEFWGV